MTWKNRKRLAMVRIQLRKTLKYLLHVGFTLLKEVDCCKAVDFFRFIYICFKHQVNLIKISSYCRLICHSVII